MKISKSISFKVLSSDLFKSTVSLGSLVSGHPLLPILNNFLFEVSEDKLIIIGSDMYTSVVTELPVKGSGKTKIAVPGSLLIETLRNLPEQPIEVIVNEESYSMVIVTMNGRYQIACENYVDFPTIPSPMSTNSFPIEVRSFKKAIKQTLFAAGKDGVNPQMCGINLSLKRDGLTFASTDGHRLVRYHLAGGFGALVANVTLSNKSMQLLNQLLPDVEGKMFLIFEDKHVYFDVDGLRIITAVVSGKYPDYERVIPSDNSFQLRVQTDALCNAVKIIEYYANRTTYEACLAIDKNTLEIWAEDLEFSNKGEVKIACAYSGEAMKIGVNAKLFLDITKHLPSKEVVIHFRGPQKAIILIPEEQKKGEDLLMLIMPVSLRNQEG